MFGFFPWRCKKCGLRLMLRKRDLASKQDSRE
jgi:DNA-directed RNA polymerase subunit RPC12/RpoP